MMGGWVKPADWKLCGCSGQYPCGGGCWDKGCCCGGTPYMLFGFGWWPSEPKGLKAVFDCAGVLTSPQLLQWTSLGGEWPSTTLAKLHRSTTIRWIDRGHRVTLQVINGGSC